VNEFASVCFCSRRGHPRSIRSYEHENTFTSSLGAHIAQIGWQTSTAGIEVMDSTPEPLKEALKAIRDLALTALDQIEQSPEASEMSSPLSPMSVTVCGALGSVADRGIKFV
jgi:hypothetical protein